MEPGRVMEHTPVDADLDLHREIRQLLAEMSTVSEAPAARLDGDRTSHSKPMGGRPVGETASIFDRWAQRFASETDDDRLRVLLHLARRDLLSIRKAKPLMLSRDPETGEVQRDKAGDPLREDTWQRDERIIDWYGGVPAIEAAMLESMIGPCSAANIRRIRVANECEPDSGCPRVPSEHRRARARQLEAEGRSERSIAREMGVGRATVRRLLGRLDEGRRAA